MVLTRSGLPGVRHYVIDAPIGSNELLLFSSKSRRKGKIRERWQKGANDAHSGR